MSSGPLGPGACSQTRIKAISDLFTSADALINPAAFVNPQLTNILNMQQGSTNALQHAETYRVYLESIVPPPPNIVTLLGQVDAFEAELTRFDSAVLQYQKMTSFFSGQEANFPTGWDTGLIFAGGAPQGWEMLGVLSFAGLLGTVKGGNQSAYVKCEVDPNDPCAKVQKILGAVTGAFDAVLNAVINGLNTMIDFASKILEYTAMITGYIENVVAIVANALAELSQQLVSLIRDGLAKLLEGIKLDPCLNAVLQNIAGVDLKNALAI